MKKTTNAFGAAATALDRVAENKLTLRSISLVFVFILVASGTVSNNQVLMSEISRARSKTLDTEAKIQQPHQITRALRLGATPPEETTRKDDSSTTSISTTQSQPKTQNPPYAYMFLIGGIDENMPAYRGFLYNVLVSKRVLDTLGSKADMWLYMQLSPNSSWERLPEDEERLLKALNIHIQYIEKPERQTFTDLIFEKFRALNMTQYRRVMFLDADVLPLNNMDYLFELSEGERPMIQPNFVYATGGEPSNAGFFMLQPREGAYEEIQQIISMRRKTQFDKKGIGWGHNFKEHGDQWDGTKWSGKNWNFYGSHVDQGLLYYWVKYHEKAVTIFFGGNKIENWIPQDGQYLPLKQSTLDGSVFDRYAPNMTVAYKYNCDKKHHAGCNHPEHDFCHFMGKTKPWQNGFSKRKFAKTDTGGLAGPQRLFFKTLFEISEELGMDITQGNVNDKLANLTRSPLGYRPSPSHFIQVPTNNETTTQ